METFDELNGEMLDAFVDGQLDTANCELVIRAMETDMAVRERVYRLRRAKDLMRLGFGSARAPARPPRRPWGGRWLSGSFGLAAGALLVFAGLDSDYVGYHEREHPSGGATHASGHLAQRQVQRVVLHISESDPKQYAAVLAYIRDFLKSHQGHESEIAVVANAGGLNLVRAGVSPVERQVAAMIRDHKNVHFIACANSIRALRAQGIKPRFINDVDTREPAMDQIIRLVQDGWRYVKVETLPRV